jgi:predicted glutamine amidotransferase
MCELFAISSAAPTRVHYSLEEFSKHGGLTHINKSGWGISYYHDGDASIFKEATPASDSRLARFIAEQGLPSRCVIAHVRRASVGGAVHENTHPFQRELGGRVHVFAHNGSLDGVEQLPLRDGRYVPIGQTDSEHAFCSLLQRLQNRLSGNALPPLAERLKIVVDFAAELRELGTANFLYFDGEHLFAHAHKRIYDDGGVLSDPRPPGLHLIKRSDIDIQGLKVTPLERELEEEVDGIMLASVPLTPDGWIGLDEGAVVVLRNGTEISANLEAVCHAPA